MPRPHPDPDGFWPSCDDQQPGVSIRPLNHADLAALLTHLDHDHDPGDTGTRWCQRRCWRCGCGPASAAPAPPPTPNTGADGPPSWAAWTHSLPWRIAAVLAIGARLPGCWPPRSFPTWRPWPAPSLAAGLAWRLRFRVTPDTLAWRRGAAGERRTARLLAPLERRGWAVLHDLAVPGSRANIDCDDVGRGGRGAV